LTGFRKAMVGMGYQHINADHIVFFKRDEGHITMLAVYVDDMIITDDDEDEIARLKVRLRKEFKVKDLGHFRYLELRIEVAHGPKRIVLFQRKYVLDEDMCWVASLRVHLLIRS
jgi:Reverse transcriptase (RNA-dependent DNA polymerase)